MPLRSSIFGLLSWLSNSEKLRFFRFPSLIARPLPIYFNFSEQPNAGVQLRRRSRRPLQPLVRPVLIVHYLKSVPYSRVRQGASPRHQREHPPAQIFTRVRGVASGFRGQLGSHFLRELVIGIRFEPSAHG